jgi:hypothetical protein
VVDLTGLWEISIYKERSHRLREIANAKYHHSKRYGRTLGKGGLGRAQ